jgi:Sec-independent protein translocase protein TatA
MLERAEILFSADVQDCTCGHLRLHWDPRLIGGDDFSDEGLRMPDMLFILLLALVIFGPRKLPEMARQVGKYLAQLRSMKSEIMSQIEDEMRKLEADTSIRPRSALSHSEQDIPTTARSEEFSEILKLIASGPSSPGQHHS